MNLIAFANAGNVFEAQSMKKICKIISLIVAIGGLLLCGCAFDLTATRPGERIDIHARPTARSNNASPSQLPASK